MVFHVTGTRRTYPRHSRGDLDTDARALAAGRGSTFVTMHQVDSAEAEWDERKHNVRHPGDVPAKPRYK